MSSASQTPSRPGPAPRFTQDQVFEAALRLIERGPPDAFTMRALADDLGIGVMTLYGYAKGKEEILDGAIRVAIRQSRPQRPAEGNWEDDLRTDARHLHATLRRHPNLTAIGLAQRTTAPGDLGVREHILTTLEEAGFDRPIALRALGVVIYYTLGFATAQAAAPAVAGGGDYADHLSDEAYEFGLELLISGLARELKATAP